jgi:3-methyladenine DNA glycosylase/8-oxoguanine DNA glycosylase
VSDAQALVRLELPVDLDLSLAMFRHGLRDPTMVREADGVWWRATRTPEGLASTRFESVAEGVRVEAWGPGATWAIDAAPELLGAKDTLDGFAPEGKLLTLHRRYRGMRIGRSRAVFEALLPNVCEQLVSTKEAWASFRGIVGAWGERAPGPRPLSVMPSPERLGRRADYELRVFGLERKRALALSALARRAPRAEEAVLMPLDLARARLLALPGVGPWTAANTAAAALGDADAVPLGDDGLPHTVTYAFTGEPRGSDARMLELLAPYAGHRGRVLRLIEFAGIAAPRFGPRRRIRAWWH